MTRHSSRFGPPRAREARSAREAIGAALAFHGISDEIRARRVLTEWTDLVGAKIASKTRPYGVNERVLMIEVASSAWLHELNLLRPQILGGLIERLGEPRLFDELRFKLAGTRRPEGLTTVRARPRSQIPARPQGPPATGAAREQIAREVEAVDDDELRALIARVRIEHDR